MHALSGGCPCRHNDWSFWDDPVSSQPMPQKMFGMVYLCDTDVRNGCLRVVEESHRRHSPLWSVVAVSTVRITSRRWRSSQLPACYLHRGP
eukprot:SAG11_NODE_3547_length_2377_cov_3.176471_4_plen_91_part_00